MNNKQKPLKIFWILTSGKIPKYFKGIARKVTAFRGSLLIYVFLIVFIFMAVYVPGMFEPKPIQAEPFTLTALGIVAIACALAVVGGYIYQNRQAVVDTAKTFYYGLTAMAKLEWDMKIAAIGVVNGQQAINISSGQVAQIKQFNQDKFIENDVIVADLPVANFDVYNTGINSPWAPDSCFIYDYVLDIDQSRIITTAVYNEIMQLAIQKLVWAGSGKYFEYLFYSQTSTQEVYKLRINGTSATSYPYNSYVFTTSYFDDLKTSVRYYYSIAADAIGIHPGSVPPRYILIANKTSGKITPALVYQEANTLNYKLRPFVSNITGTNYGENIDRTVVVKDLDIAIDPSRALDYNFDIVDIDGNRYVKVADTAGQLIGLYPSQTQAAEWASAYSLAEIAAIETQTNELKSYLSTYFVPYIYSLSYLNSLTYDTAGALKVTVTNASEIGGGTSTTFPELDLPQVSYNMPNLELLSNKFPFSIPFDFYNAIANLSATPQAPVFDINFPAEIFGGEADMQLDFNIFENLAKVIRWIILLGFVIGLILLTRRLIRG